MTAHGRRFGWFGSAAAGVLALVASPQGEQLARVVDDAVLLYAPPGLWVSYGRTYA